MAKNELKAERFIVVDMLGIPITCRVGTANMCDQRGAERLLGGLGAIYPGNRIIMADAGIDRAIIRLMPNLLASR